MRIAKYNYCLLKRLWLQLLCRNINLMLARVKFSIVLVIAQLFVYALQLCFTAELLQKWGTTNFSTLKKHQRKHEKVCFER